MIIPNGRVIYTNPLTKYSDGDSLTDGEEMGNIENFEDQSFIKQINLKFNGFDSDIYAQYFDYKSDPNKEDSDGDGLLDGKATYVNSKKVAPKDPDPLKRNGPENAWKTHIAQIESGENLATDYSNDYYENEKFEAEIKFWGI